MKVGSGFSGQWGPSGIIKDHPPWLSVSTHLDIAQVGVTLPHPKPVGRVNRATVQQRLVDLQRLQVGIVGEGLQREVSMSPQVPDLDGVGIIDAIFLLKKIY